MVDDKTLDAAAAEAITEEESVVDLEEAADEVVEEEIEEVEEEVEEDIEEQLPVDHKERSNLGRKVAALLKKSDKTDEVMSQMAQVIERLTPQEEDETLDEYVTKKDLLELQNKPKLEANKYENDFKSTFMTLCEKDNLTDEQEMEVWEILYEKYNTKVTGEAKVDSALNYASAKADYFAEKKPPLRKSKPPGVIKKQVVKKSEPKFKKLDAASESFLKFIERTDGLDTANARRKSI